jgi:hypothetical protein
VEPDGVNDFDRAADALEPAAFRRTAGKAVEPAIRKAATAVQQAVRAAARPHRRTGKLERFVSVTGGGTGLETELRVHAGGRVAHLITGGTVPHDISAVRSRALPIAGVGGAVGFAATVHHPGSRADPFVARGVAASEREVSQITDRATRELAHDLAESMTGRS